MNAKRWWLTAGLIIAAALLSAMWQLQRQPAYGVDIARNGLKGWQNLGGEWSAHGGEVTNDSYERGAKLLFGPTTWSDYAISADVELRGAEGDAGLIVRSNDEELGSNAYNGYYAGLRTLDGRLVLGRADFGWLESRTAVFPNGLERAHWYRLEVVAVGCTIAARATDPATGAQSFVSIKGNPCITHGRIGLRSYGAGACWRNLKVERANAATLAAFYASRTNHQENALKGAAHAEANTQSASTTLTRGGKQIQPALESIGSLRYGSIVDPAPVTIRGTVILRSPVLVVQDPTGGISIPEQDPSRFAAGIEIQASGTPAIDGFTLQLKGARVRVLGLGRPLPPKSITATDAATGAYDAQYIEVTGRLVQSTARQGLQTLLVEADSQAFLAMLPAPSYGVPSLHLPRGSLIRVRGVESVDPHLTRNRVPFVLLVPSPEGVELLASPPWWSLQNLVWLVPIAVILLLLSQMLRVRARHRRTRAVMEERERLGSEIHDTLAQGFAGVGYQLQAVRASLANGGSAVSDHVELAIEMVRHSHQEARRSIASMQGDLMDGAGLAALLEERARHMAHGTALRIHAATRGEPKPTSLRVNDAMFRIGLEAIANTLRHASAGTVTIELVYEGRIVQLSVADDGRGFHADDELQGLGLRSMRRRAEAIGATLIVYSEPGAGTRVEMRSPLDTRATWIERFFEVSHGRHNGHI